MPVEAMGRVPMGGDLGFHRPIRALLPVECTGIEIEIARRKAYQKKQDTFNMVGIG